MKCGAVLFPLNPVVGNEVAVTVPGAPDLMLGKTTGFQLIVKPFIQGEVRRRTEEVGDQQDIPG